MRAGGDRKEAPGAKARSAHHLDESEKRRPLARRPSFVREEVVLILDTTGPEVFVVGCGSHDALMGNSMDREGTASGNKLLEAVKRGGSPHQRREESLLDCRAGDDLGHVLGCSVS